jgi:hypothetical protein
MTTDPIRGLREDLTGMNGALTGFHQGDPGSSPAGTGKQPETGREFPCGSRLRFLFYGPLSGILKIRQIHNIFIPHCFHWNGPLKRA